MSDKKTKRVITSKTQARHQISSKTNLKGHISQLEPVQFLFQKKNFIYLGIGLLLMVIGFFLMAGGKMPSPDVWNSSLIYSKRIVVLSPIFLLSGLGMVAFSIFKK